MSPDVMAYNVMFRKIRYSRNYEAKNVCLTTTTTVSAHLAAAAAISNTFSKAFQLITTPISHYKAYNHSKYLTLCCALSPHVGGGPPPTTAAIGLAADLNNDNS